MANKINPYCREIFIPFIPQENEQNITPSTVGCFAEKSIRLSNWQRPEGIRWFFASLGVKVAIFLQTKIAQLIIMIAFRAFRRIWRADCY
jgi:hypothetical protein